MANKVRSEVDNAVKAVENRIYDAILTAMDNVKTATVEMAVRSITELSGRGPNSVVQNPDQSDFSGNMEIILLVAASSRAYLNINRNKHDETRNFENFEDGDFPVLRPNC